MAIETEIKPTFDHKICTLSLHIVYYKYSFMKNILIKSYVKHVYDKDIQMVLPKWEVVQCTFSEQ